MCCMDVFPALFLYTHECRGSQKKRVLDPLGPELQMVVSCHLGAGNRIPGPLQDWPVLLTTEASFQSRPTFLRQSLAPYDPGGILQ